MCLKHFGLYDKVWLPWWFDG